jgi:RimJ/RimL family protein N-acetyltransferase
MTSTSTGALAGLSLRDIGIAASPRRQRALLDFLFCELNLHRVSARTGKDNIRSWKLMERLGMRREAHFRQSHTNLDNRWADEYVCAVLESDWTTVRNASR